MFFSKKLVSVVILAAVVAACATPSVPLSRAQVGQLSNGASMEDINNAVATATPLATYSFDARGKKYDARHYAMVTGTTTAFVTVCTPFCMTIPVTAPVSVPYVVVQDAETQKLFAWGTIEELSKNPDDSISSIMPSLKAAYDIQIASKK